MKDTKEIADKIRAAVHEIFESGIFDEVAETPGEKDQPAKDKTEAGVEKIIAKLKACRRI